MFEIIVGAAALIVAIIVIAAVCKTAQNTRVAADYERRNYRYLKALLYKQGVIDDKGHFIGFRMDDVGTIQTGAPVAQELPKKKEFDLS